MKVRPLKMMMDLTRLPAVNNFVIGSDEDVEFFLQTVDRQLEPHLKQALNLVPEGKGLKEGIMYQVHSGGKRIRAALCVTVCELFCGSPQRALSFAAAIEHLQNFSLIHDILLMETRREEARHRPGPALV
jgi:geranylgeranyl pyrophosphate synthase